jgi:hypothetical protein
MHPEHEQHRLLSGTVAYCADHLLVLLRDQFAGAPKLCALREGGGQLWIAFAISLN